MIFVTNILGLGKLYQILSNESFTVCVYYMTAMCMIGIMKSHNCNDT